ncbi:MAG: hypothetical protein ABI444_05620 [Candidatus Kapaibacterium sp.]|jgi:hypothetical protein
MKRFSTLLPILFLIVFFQASSAHAQNRAFGAKSFLLDDGLVPTHTVTLNFPGPGAGPASNVVFNFPNSGGTLVPIGALDGQTLRWNGGTSLWEASSLLLNSGTAIGIGSAPFPSVGKLSLLDNITATGFNPVSIYFLSTVNPAAGPGNIYYGLNQETQAQGSTPITAIDAGPIGIAGRGTSIRIGANSVDRLIGVVGSGENNGTATANNVYGLYGQIKNFTGGTVNNAYAVHGIVFGGSNTVNASDFHAANAVNSVTNLYGLLIDPLTTGTSSNTAILYNYPTNPFAVNGDGTVWLGGNPPFPTGSLAVTQTTTDAGGNPMIRGTLTVNPVSAYNWGSAAASFQFKVGGTGDMSSANVIGVSGSGSMNRVAPNTVGSLIGGTFSAIASGSANITKMFGVSTLVRNFGSGTAQNAYSMYASDGFGPMTNQYGLFIEQMTAGTNNTAILYNHATNPFSVNGDGSVWIGGFPPLPTGSLAVTQTTPDAGGDPMIQGRLTVNPVAPYNWGSAAASFDYTVGGTGDMSGASVGGVTGSAHSNRAAPNTVGSLIGGSFDAIALGSANTTKMYGATTLIRNFGTGTAQNAYNFYASNAFGPITNLYGMFIEQMTAGTKNVAILYNHATQPFTVTGSGQVGIGTATPNAQAALHIATTDAMIVPVGSTAQRPSAPAIGMIRFNTSTAHFEGYNGATWNNLD